MGAGGYLSDQCQSVPSVRAFCSNQPDGGKYNGIFARFDLIEFLTVMEREKTTRISFVPTLVTRLLNDSRLKNFHFDSVKEDRNTAVLLMNYTTVVRANGAFPLPVRAGVWSNGKLLYVRSFAGRPQGLCKRYFR